MPLVIVALGVALLIFLIVKLKLNTFVSLILVSFLVGLILGIPTGKLSNIIVKGIASQLGDLAIIFGFGSIIGKLVSDAGGGYRIAHTLIDKFGRKYIQFAVIIASFIIGLALFFQVGLVVVFPIIFTIADAMNLPLLYLAIPMATTINVMHCLIPPHPAPTAISGILHADLGQVIIYGIIVAIPTIIISGPFFNFCLRKLKPKMYRVQRTNPALGTFKKFQLTDTPKFGISVLTAMMPVILIGIATIIKYVLPNNGLNKVIQFIGDPEFSMLLSAILALYTMGIRRKKKAKEIEKSISQAITQISVMFFIIGAGGAFKQVLVAGGISSYVSGLFSGIHMSPIIAAWIITAILRVSLGSSTVAAMTAAGVVGPLVSQANANVALVVLAIGAGSIFADHVNDGGFWMVKGYFGLSLKDAFLTWTTGTSVAGVAGLLSILVFSIFV